MRMPSVSGTDEELGSAEVFLDGVIERAIDARPTGLLDAEVRMRALDGGDRCKCPFHPVVRLGRVPVEVEGTRAARRDAAICPSFPRA